MTDRDLPDGWRWATLGQMCEIKVGRTPRRANTAYWGGSHLWATISDITSARGELSTTAETLSDLGAEVCTGRLIPAGTLLFSFKLTIGAMAVAKTAMYTNEAIAGLLLRDSTLLDRDYLQLALSATSYDDLTGHAAMGRTLNRRTLDQIRLPLPPLEEQRAIVGSIYNQLNATERAQQAAQAQLAALEAMPAALLRKFFPRSRSAI